MKLKTQFTVPKKDSRDLNCMKGIQTSGETLKQSCIDYPYEKDCLVCCN